MNKEQRQIFEQCSKRYSKESYNMPAKSRKNVISFRVREVDEDHFLVESYSMKLTDELAFFTDSKVNYYIRYNSYIKRKQNFLGYINRKCYDFDYLYQPNNVEELNAFLATHYFTHGAPKNIEDINKLNELARDYIEGYNLSIYNDLDRNEGYRDVDNRLARARSLLRKGVTHIECVNVAQANFTVGYESNKNKPVAIFDIGINSSVTKNRRYAENKLNQVDGNGVVIISHYDYDHVNGYRYLSDETPNRVWILPQRRLSPTPAERNLLSLLKPSNCIFLKDVDYSRTSFDPALHILKIGNISIYQGNAKKTDSDQSTDENARSLICLLQRNKSILLPGDCLYEEFPTDFNVDYLVVPHHCCYYNKPIKHIDLPRLRELIIFAGPHRGYKHPDISHLNRLNQSGCQVVYLMNHGNYYFDHKNELAYPTIAVTSQSHIIAL